jgi:hypothetical protein
VIVRVVDIGVINYHHRLSSFIVTYHRVCYKSNTTDATSGAGTAYSFGAHELLGSCCSIYSFLCCVWYIIMYPFLSILFWPLQCLSFVLHFLIGPFLCSHFSYESQYLLDIFI